MNPLLRFFQETDEPLALFARRCGIGADVLEAVIARPADHDLHLIRLICRETGGVVELGDLLSSGPGVAPVLEFENARGRESTWGGPDLETLTDEVVRTLRRALDLAVLPAPLAPGLLDIYSEAITNTYIAMSFGPSEEPKPNPAVTGTGPAATTSEDENGDGRPLSHHDRLAQALQPTLAKILETKLAPPEAAERSARLAQLAIC
ncbi:MAG: hypothetical protein AAGH42_05090 [Pseudomonadota bacterium]